MSLRKEQKLLVWACLAALGLWVFGPLRTLLLPLIYYNTHVHELCHALSAMLTGGRVLSIQVFADGSGLTRTIGGSALLTASAGYVGSSIVGGILIAGSRTQESARKMLWVAMGFLAFAFVFLRGDVVGIVSAVFWIAALGLSAKYLKGDATVFAAQFLGAQQCLTSAHSFLALIAISANDRGHSDAENLERITGVSGLVWSLAWLLVAVVSIGIGIKISWSNQARRRPV